MSSKREQIISALATALASTSGVSGRVFRGRPYPARLTETPCIFLSWVSDQPNYDNLNTMEWLCQLRLTIITRDEEADVAADPIMISAHEIIMGMRTVSGLALDVLPAEQRMDIIEGDKPVGMLQALYNIRYRTAQNELDA